MNNIKVLFFASAREATGTSSTTVSLESTKDQSSGIEIGSTARSLVAKLAETYPYLDFERDQISVAVNKQYIEEDVILKDGDEVALLPPIAGG